MAGHEFVTVRQPELDALRRLHKEAADKVVGLTAERDALRDENRGMKIRAHDVLSIFRDRIRDLEAALNSQSKMLVDSVTRIRDLEAALIYLYNKGYHAGHHDTVEACYTDIMDCDMGEYHADEVNDICAALHREQEGGSDDAG